jgi:cyclopropane fatty-acyl-phospholipid synthase-like methyltransferase
MAMKALEKQFRKPSGLLGKITGNRMLRSNQVEYDKIIDTLEIKPHSKLFEIGYGPGYGFGKILSEIDCTISGIDFSELMYNEAQKRNAKFIEKGKVDLHYGNFLDSQCDFKGYDLVYCLNVVYFWEDLVLPFTKINNMLNPDGAFCFYMAGNKLLNKHNISGNGIFNKYDIEEAREALEKAGFKNITYYYDDGYFIRAEK